MRERHPDCTAHITGVLTRTASASGARAAVEERSAVHYSAPGGAVHPTCAHRIVLCSSRRSSRDYSNSIAVCIKICSGCCEYSAVHLLYVGASSAPPACKLGGRVDSVGPRPTRAGERTPRCGGARERHLAGGLCSRRLPGARRALSGVSSS